MACDVAVFRAHPSLGQRPPPDNTYKCLPMHAGPHPPPYPGQHQLPPGPHGTHPPPNSGHSATPHMPQSSPRHVAPRGPPPRPHGGHVPLPSPAHYMDPASYASPYAPPDAAASNMPHPHPVPPATYAGRDPRPNPPPAQGQRQQTLHYQGSRRSRRG
ncbi:hypothetical protein VTK56DRAFT_9319 [Thermocarpiscus australiensis]